MKLNFTLFAFTISMLCFAQDYNVAMQVSKSDLEQNHYARDSTASALVIYDYGNSFLDRESFALRVQIKQKIKILRTDGIDRGQYEIKLYKGKSSSEKIKNIKGNTYNLENGAIVQSKLTSSAIFEEENEKYTLVKFVLPNVKVGSVVTVSYETQSRFMTKYQPWYFQGRDPVLYSEYNTSIPGNYEYHIKLVGKIPLDINEAKLEESCIEVSRGGYSNCMISKYVMKNIPAYKPEDFTTTALNYMSRIEYEMNTFRSFDGRVDKMTKKWKDVDKELKTDKNFGRQIGKSSLVKDILPKSISEINNDLDKAKAIYQYVLETYKWNGKSERYDVSIKNLVREKIGSAFEINLLLANLLTNQNFTVYPILISTRTNGLATKIYPVLTDFNYIILKTSIDGKDYYIDATDPYLSFGELPFKCLNQYGRLIDFEDGSYWEDIEVNEYSSRQHRVNLSSFKDDIFNGLIESKFSGYHAHNVKRRFDEAQQEYKEKKADKYSDIIIEDHNIINFDKTKIDFNEQINFSLEPELIGNKIYLNPFLIKFFEENPFKLQERTYPIDFGYKDVYNYVMKIELGEGLKVLEIPDNFSYALPNKSGSFIFNVESKDNELIIYFKVKFDFPIYAPEFYDYLKMFMSIVVKTQKNTIILLEKQ